MKGGFIALMSAIIISAALMVAALGGSLVGFYQRDTVLDAELKEHSAALADACANEALLQLASNPNWPGTITLPVGDDACAVGPVSLSAGQALFQARGVYRHSYTNLQITFDTQNLIVISWQEVPVSSF